MRALYLALSLAVIASLCPRIGEPENRFGLRESPFARSLARLLTDQSNVEFHFGLQQFPKFAADWVTGLRQMAGFRDKQTHPPTRSEVRGALIRGEEELNMAYNCDPSFYPAYQCYFTWLTLDISGNPNLSEAWEKGAQNNDADPNDRKPLTPAMEKARAEQALRISTLTLARCDTERNPEDCLTAAGVKINVLLYTTGLDRWKQEAPKVGKEVNALIARADALAPIAPWKDRPRAHRAELERFKTFLHRVSRVLLKS